MQQKSPSMLQNMIDDLKDSTGTAVRMTSLAAGAALSAFVTTSFLCAAIFVMVLQRYGLIAACLSGAAVFFTVTLIAAGCYLYRRRQIRALRVAAARQSQSTFATALADPMVIAAGLQIVRFVGPTRLLPVLAIGGIAFGLLARRPPGEAAE